MKNIYIIILAILIMSLCGCVSDTSDNSPVDEISREVKEAMGDSFGFDHRRVYGNGAIDYNFVIHTYDAAVIRDFYNICSELLPGDEEKIVFSVCFEISGGRAVMFSARNYNDVGDVYEGLYYLRILDQLNYYNEEANDLTLYSQIEGIKELHVDKGIQDKADDMGIDWYSYWPDLEKIVVEER